MAAAIAERLRIRAVIWAGAGLALSAAAVLLSPHAALPAVAILAAGLTLLLMVLGAGLRDMAAAVIRRRDLRRARAALALTGGPALLVDPEGVVLAQNSSSGAQFGPLTGRSLPAALARLHARPDRAWSHVGKMLSRGRPLRIDLGQLGVHEVTRLPGTDLQLWCAEMPAPPALAGPGEEASDGFDRLPVALVTLAAGGIIRRINDAARDLLGEAAPGQALGIFLDGLGREIGDWVSDICAGRMAGGTEVLHLRGAGGDRFVQASLRRTDDGCAIAVLSDVSAMKTLEAQFVQSQKMQAIGQLAGGIAHDFNNLLTAITGHCDLLMLRHDKSAPDFADLDQISQNANRAAALVRQLLAFSRKQTLKPRIMDLRDTLADLTHLLNRLVGERIYLTFDHDPALRRIRGDRRQLEQVIMNLVVNARDAMPRGGDIVISTDNFHAEEATPIGQGRLPPGDYVRVRVCDQGCGIPAEELGKIFEPFYTTKRTGEGTGLGLSTAYGIVKQTGGYIFCDSAPGQGSTFLLFFPAHDPPASPEEEALEPPSAPALRPEVEATVLLVEDEAPVRAFASRALKLQGLNVIQAASAEEALALLADHNLRVDVFVTDVVMPGMDGPTWVRTALRDRPHTRIVFMSGYAEEVFGEGHEPVPNSVFLAKPFSLTELTGLVAQQLRTGPGLE